MCLDIDKKEHPRYMPKTARKDIRVLKVLRKKYKKKGYLAPIQEFDYQLGTTYKLEGKLKAESFKGAIYDTVDEGFHSFRIDDFRVTKWQIGRKTDLKPIMSPLGSIMLTVNNKKLTTFRVSDENPLHIVEAVIPKGAKYFIGHNGDIVSSSLRLGNKVHRINDLPFDIQTVLS